MISPAINEKTNIVAATNPSPKFLLAIFQLPCNRRLLPPQSRDAVVCTGEEGDRSRTRANYKNMKTSADRDLELEQCYARMAVTAIAVVWAIWLLAINSPALGLVVKVESFLVVYLILHWLHVRRFPGYFPLRRIFSLLADHGVCVALMFIAGGTGAIGIFANIWITLGTGFRFGPRWMTGSAVIAVIAIMILGMVPGYWNQHVLWIVALLMLNTVIPVYVGVLVRGLEEARAKVVEYASAMEKMALRDSLTGLPNRAALYAELERACAHAMRHKSSIALFYFDLDGFKKVNDVYGHAVGDLLLKETALRVGEALRAEDVLARLGGDEYVAVLQLQESKECAKVVASRILEAIVSIETIDGHPVSVSASVGGVIVNGGHANRLGAEQIVHEADKNMYVAKNGGKSRIVLTELLGESSYTHLPEVAQMA